MSNIKRYRKKPVVIEAARVHPSTFHEMVEWGNGQIKLNADGIYIDTLEGIMIANPGDWVIKGVKGEFYPCKPDIFEATYEGEDETAIP